MADESIQYGIWAFAFGAFTFVLMILWALLPFLIMGTNKRLNRLIVLMHENNTQQEAIRGSIEKLAGEAERTLGK